jgi:NitT/TauT family transport system substrate-binding protein
MKAYLPIFCILLALVVSACGSNVPPTATTSAAEGADAASTLTPTTLVLVPLRVCYTAITGTQAVTWFAFEHKLFEKYGLQVELTYINSGTRAVIAMLAGDMDICQLAGSAVVNAVAAEQDVIMIAGLYNVYPASLMVTAEINTPQDLVGKALAITQPGSSTDVGTRLALEYLGLEAETQVALLALGEESTRMAAMDAGQVSGTMLTSPDTIVGQQLGYHELVNLGTLGIPYQHTGIGTTRSYLEAHFPEAKSFMKAIVEAITLMKADPDGTKAVMAQYLLIDPVAGAAELQDAYQTLILDALESIPYPTLPGIQTLIDYQVATNPALAQVTPEQAIDRSVLDTLQAEGFFTLP